MPITAWDPATEWWPREAAFIERVARGARRGARTLGAERVRCGRGTLGVVCTQCGCKARVIYTLYLELINYDMAHYIHYIHYIQTAEGFAVSDVSSQIYII